MKNFKYIQFILLLIAGIALSGSLVSCYESSSEQAPPAINSGGGDGGGGTTPGLAFNGKIYYQQNCSLCHAAGADDTTVAFSTDRNKMDLAKQNSKIKTDISALDTKFNTMGRFNNIDEERVNDLKKYLSSL